MSDSNGSDSSNEGTEGRRRHWNIDLELSKPVITHIETINRKYSEPHRFYHNKNHIATMWIAISEAEEAQELTHLEAWYLRIATQLHDYVYDPYKTDNESQSAEHLKILYPGLSDRDKYVITVLILSTAVDTYKAYPRGSDDNEVDFLVDWIRYLDLISFSEQQHLLPGNFINIMKEYQMYPYPAFREANLGVLETFRHTPYMPEHVYKWYTSWVKSYRPKIGVFALSANPFHIGHMSVLEQAEKVFDKVIIMHPTISKEHDDRIRKTLPFHEIISFKGLLIDQLRPLWEYADLTLIRGLRNGNDLEYEINMHAINNDLGMYVPTVYYITAFPHISSTVIRDIETISEVSKFIPDKYNYYTGSVNKYDYDAPWKITT